MNRSGRKLDIKVWNSSGSQGWRHKLDCHHIQVIFKATGLDNGALGGVKCC
jgi:hypothetical protein